MAAPVMTMLTPYFATAGIGWLYVRRIRRHFGRQPWQPRRTIARLVLLALVTTMLVITAVALPHVLIGMAVGAVLGIALGVVAVRHTHIERVDGKACFTPNPWIGAGLTVLLLGRLAWRWSQGAFSSGAAQTFSQASPFTMAIFATLIGYSISQSIGLLLRMRHLD